MPVIEIDPASLDEDLFDLGPDFERVAVGHEDRRVLAELDGTDAVGHAEDLCRIERHALERRLFR